MKYQNVVQFKKNFEGAQTSLYMVVIEDDYERKQCIDEIVRKKKSVFLSWFSAEDRGVEHVVESFFTHSLWGEIPLVVLDRGELLKKEEIDHLLSNLSHPFSGIFILAAREKKNLSSLCNKIEKDGVLLDMEGEKFWDKRKRLADYITETCSHWKKSIALSALEKLLDNVSLDVSFLEKEVEKLLLYVGDKRAIQQEDVLMICGSEQQATFWKIAEEMIWEDGMKQFPSLAMQEVSFFQGLVTALRYQLQLGYKLSSSNEMKEESFSRLPPKILEKRKEKARKCGSSFFQRGLLLLSEMEVLSRSNVVSFSVLMDCFYSKLMCCYE